MTQNNPNTVIQNPVPDPQKPPSIWEKLFNVNTKEALLVAGASFVGTMLGLFVDWMQLIETFKVDPSGNNSGWIMVKITGFSKGSYGPSQLKGSSNLTSLIYTDQQPSDDFLNLGQSQRKDFSVLKNVDDESKLPNGNLVSKRNTQTFQARLVQASRNEEVVCLFVYGIRDNEKSQFLNILKFKTVDQDNQDKYNNLIESGLSQGQPGLVDLTRTACIGKPLLP